MRVKNDTETNRNEELLKTNQKVKTKANSKAARLLSLLLTVCLLVTFMPAVPVFAGYEDGCQCYGNECGGHWHWDDHMCDNCGMCSDDCDALCYLEWHCYSCGNCVLDAGYTEECECGQCNDCMESDDMHCLECHKCMRFGGRDICNECKRCEDCAWDICDACGFCYECIENDAGIHCLDCGDCSFTTEMHKEDDGAVVHCEYCAEYCEDCDECLTCYEIDGVEICDECGKCEGCCIAAAESYGCDCGMLCIESAEWDDHFCEQCGECFDNIEQCELCNLCSDCCESNSECSKGMCVEDDDYEDHFCIDCGSCFCDVTLCEECDDVRCLDCCRLICEEAGCDCGDICCCDSEFENHIATMHSGEEIGEHTASPQNAWTIDASNHYHACRFCEEAGHITGKATHQLNANTGICSVCGYKTGAKLFVTRQPKDVFVKVPDINTSEDIYQENLKTFSVSAQGEGELSYQWYYRINSVEWLELKDDSKFGISGSTTSKLVHYVPGDACCSEYSFYCKITDEGGNTVASDIAKIHASHVYKDALNVEEKGDYHPKYIYFSADEADNDKWWSFNKGHKWTCVGDGCTEAKTKIEPHRFSTTVVKGTEDPTKELKDYYKRVCMDCGWKIYEPKHVHEFELPDWTTEEGKKLIENETTQFHHVLHCTIGSCDQTKDEAHAWDWRIASWPVQDAAGKGAMRRDCGACQYPEEHFKMMAVGDDGKNKEIDWDMTNLLVRVGNCYANKPVVKPGETLIITPVKVENKKCTGFTDITLSWWDTSQYKTNSVSGLTSCKPIQNADGTWTLTVPSSAPKGGQIYIKPKYDTCSHSKTPVLVRQKVPGCIYNGYTGDKVCPDCDKIMEVGDPIEARGYHGELTPVAGTEKAADVGSCTSGEKGYSGDSKCKDCGLTIAGKKTVNHGPQTTWKLKSYVPETCSNEGYSGDYHCSFCDKIMEKGHVLKIKHRNTAIENIRLATCTGNGYTGDTFCKTCEQIVAYGNSIPSEGHKWNSGVTTKSATKDSVGEMTYTCTTCHATKTSNIAKLGAVQKYVVTVNGSYATHSGSGSYINASTVNIKAGTHPSGYSFAGWTSEDGVVFGDEFLPETSFEVQGKNVTVTANWNAPGGEIAVADITVTAPKTGATPSTVATAADSTYTAFVSDWNPADSSFKTNTAYAVTVKLEAPGTDRFTKNTEFRINGNKATLIAPNPINGNVAEVTIGYTFPKTDADSAGSGTSSDSSGKKPNVGGTTTKPEGDSSSGSGAAKPETITKPDGTTVTTEKTSDGTEKVTEKKPDGTETVTEKKPDGTEKVTEIKADGSEKSTEKKPDGTETVMEKKPDGTEKVTEIKADGSEKSTEKKPDGTETETEKKPDGSEKVTEKQPDGTKVVTDIASDGKTTAEVTLPSGKDKAEVEVPAPLGSKDGTVTAKVTDKKTGEVKEVKASYSDGKVSVSVAGDSTIEILDDFVPLASAAIVFSDVADSHWAKEAIDKVVAKGLFKGTTATQFSPNANMTREQMWMVLSRFAGNDFATMKEAADWAISKGITDGKNPKSPVTREQFVTLMWRTLESPASSFDMSKYSDSSKVSSWAKEAMAWAVETGLVSGTSATELSPTATATRAQIATIFARYLDK